MFPFLFFGTTQKAEKPSLFLYSTLTRKKERFMPLHKDFVRIYHCGPTVYDFIHIGNLRSFLLADTLRRTLVLNGYKVRQVINITDVGQLVSDGDDGEDKMTKGVIREGLPRTLEGMKTLADRYTEAFLSDIDALNVLRPHALPRASEHITADIALVETLIQKEYAYETPDGIYFDTLRFPRYGVLGDIPLEKLQAGARVSENTHKRNPTDFALWKKNDTTGWESPWGKGFPGWHIECSAMAMEYLGKELDIHTGGKDLIGTHHNNEIAQSECATGKKFVRYWLHNEYVHVAHTKISKSLGNSITLSHIVHAGYSPLDYRYWILTAHYRSPVDFTFPALDAVRTARERLERVFVEQCLSVPTGKKDPVYAERLLLAINDDLDTPKTIALLWEVARDATLSPEDKRATLLHIDSVLGIGLTQIAQRNKAPRSLSPMHMDDTGIPKEILDILAKREEARKKKDWKEADALRDTLIQKGYEVTDTPEGMRVQRHN